MAGTQYQRWLVFVVATAGLGGLFAALALPGAWLLGPLLVGATFGARGTALRVPRLLTIVAQAALGAFLGSTLDADVLHQVARQWPLVLGSALTVVFLSMALGAALMRWRVLPGSAAVWGLAPGAAPAMVVMADAWGADARLVALLQYLRVALVIATTALVSAWLGAAPGTAAYRPVRVDGLALAGCIALLGVIAALRSRLPVGALVVPMVGGGVLSLAGVAVQVPAVVVACAAAVIGAGIGLSFTRHSLRDAAALLPRLVAAIVALMLLCAAAALVLSLTLRFDFLTLWLATSPGGLDSIALIAAATHVDVSFVIAVQTTRFVLVMLLGPSLSRAVASRLAQG